MTAFDWSGGQLLTLAQGDTAQCQGGLNQQQLYGLFFYNTAQNDTGADLSVVWSQSQPPVQVHVPGTTGNQGLASVVFLSGNDTNTVSVAMVQNQPGAKVQAFIGSVKMPTNTAGINNQALPADGQLHAFTAFTRYYAVPASHWYNAQIQSDINQFISVQFSEQRAVVNIVNSLVDPGSTIQGIASAKGMYTTNTSAYQTTSFALQGNGQQMVWINADSVQNSKSARISLQSLSAIYEAHAR
jgi:hypothetical protein